MQETAGECFSVRLNSRKFAWNKVHKTQRAETSSIIKPHVNEVYLTLVPY